MKLLRILAAVVLSLVISATVASGQTWQPLTNQPSFNPGVMLLLTDGTVIMHSEPNCLTCTPPTTVRGTSSRPIAAAATSTALGRRSPRFLVATPLSILALSCCPTAG
jgi:hypothetical protein